MPGILMALLWLGQTPAGPAAAPPSAAGSYGPDVPQHGILVLKAAKYTVPLCAQQAWTIHKIEYDGRTVAHEHGFYGTVLIPRDGKWWGTGHTEGGREIVHALKLTADGREQPVTVGETVAGRKLTLRKDSTIWKLDCLAEITVTEECVVERTQLSATADVNLKLLYFFMHCFVPTTATWTAELPNGALAAGQLRSGGGFEINRNTRWVAQFEPAMQLGFLCYTPQVIDGPGSMSKIWNLKNYHKFYYQANTERGAAARAEAAITPSSCKWCLTRPATGRPPRRRPRRSKKLYPPK